MNTTIFKQAKQHENLKIWGNIYHMVVSAYLVTDEIYKTADKLDYRCSD
jgi:hypothetical protein